MSEKYQHRPVKVHALKIDDETIDEIRDIVPDDITQDVVEGSYLLRDEFGDFAIVTKAYLDRYFVRDNCDAWDATRALEDWRL